MPSIAIGYHPSIYNQCHQLSLGHHLSIYSLCHNMWCLFGQMWYDLRWYQEVFFLLASNQDWNIYQYRIQKTKHVISYTERLVSYDSFITVIIIAIMSHGLMWWYPSSWSWTWAVTNLDAVLSHEGTMLHSSRRPLTISIRISLFKLVAGKIQEHLQRNSRQWQQGRRMGVHSNIYGSWCSMNISYQYRKSHRGDKTFVRTSYLHNGIYYSDKTAPLYSINLLLFISNRIRFIKIR